MKTEISAMKLKCTIISYKMKGDGGFPEFVVCLSNTALLGKDLPVGKEVELVLL